MFRTLRRLVLLAFVGAVGYAIYVTLRSRNEAAPWPREAPQWPPVDTGAASERWLPPVDGQCPPGYPIKANDRSHIFHVPGGRSYERTVPERCYADSEAAQADGYRPAKA